MNSRKLMLTLAVIAFAYAPFTLADNDGRHIHGGGTTIVTGGTGVPGFVPVITKFAIHWGDGHNHFECLALVPSAAAGTPGSGNFDKNVMYVTGVIESAETHGRHATVSGKATVTGLGAGSGLAFTVEMDRGGVGTDFVLTVSGLTFDEVVTEGAIKF
jgi:hypothetical protein